MTYDHQPEVAPEGAAARVFALALHADYRCRHSGACCGTDWDVPLELPIYRSLAEAVAAGRIAVAPESAGLAPFVVEPDLPEEAAAIFERNDRGACVFFERESRLCIVHRDLGAPALPATCRHFPRLAVRDGRGTHISLSHFCPTAASMLFREDAPTAVVEGPGAFPPGDYDGLVVAPDDLPPLLRPDMLMDLEGYHAWERHMVARCAADAGPESMLATIWRDAALLRRWRPGGATLAETIGGLPAGALAADAPVTLDDSLAAHAEVLLAVPEEWRPEPDEAGLREAYVALVFPGWPGFSRPLARYLAAKAFASWTAYQGRGIATIVRGLEAALALVRVEAARGCRDAGRALDADLLREAIRSADFALNHLAVGEDLASQWSAVEGRPDPA